MSAEIKDLTKLIEVCKKQGVVSLKYKDLCVVFGSQTTTEPLTPSVRQTKAAESQEQAIEKEALQDVSREIDEEELSTMQIENPSLYEKLMIERELEDAKSATGTRAEDPQH